jgi:hypothetical protein
LGLFLQKLKRKSPDDLHQISALYGQEVWPLHRSMRIRPLSKFAIDSLLRMGYLEAAPRCARYLKTEKTALGLWLLVLGQKRQHQSPPPGAAVPHDPSLNPTPINTHMRETYANLGCLGISPSQVRANVGWPGEGEGIADIARNRRDREDQKPLNPRQSGMPLG